MSVLQFPSLIGPLCPPEYETVPVSIGNTKMLSSGFPFVSAPGRFGYSMVTVKRLNELLANKFTIISQPITLQNARDIVLTSEPEELLFMPRGCTETLSLKLSPNSTDDQVKRWYKTIMKYFESNVLLPYDLCESCSDIVLVGYADAIADDDEHQRRCNFIDRTLLPHGFYWADSFDSIPANERKACVGCENKTAIRRCNAQRST